MIKYIESYAPKYENMAQRNNPKPDLRTNALGASRLSFFSLSYISFSIKSSANIFACAITVSTAFSCKSGG